MPEIEQFDGHTTVEQIADGSIILVGEKHTSSKSADLASRVIDAASPAAVAIEAPPTSRGSSAGMSVARDYSNTVGVPLVKIDEPRSDRLANLDSYPYPILNDANEFTHPIEDDGDLDPRAIHDVRTNIMQEYGEDAYYYMYPQREEAMAERLHAMEQSYADDGPIVAIVGAFHVPAIRNQYYTTTATSIGASRKQNEVPVTA